MSKAKESKFEDAIEELEAIIARIESGDCGLEESIAQYEKGVKLLGRCKSILQVVEQRIAELTTTSGGGGGGAGRGGLAIKGESEAADPTEEGNALADANDDTQPQDDPTPPANE